MPELTLPRLEPARKLAKTVLPDRAVLAVQNRSRRREGYGASAIDLEYARMIRDADLDELRDAAFLEHDLLPRLGLNAEEIESEFPEELWPYCGYGLLHWQFPRQFAPYLVKLSELGISSYLEIGVRHGGTFVITVEYLSRFGRVDRALGVDLDVHATLKEYARRTPAVRVCSVNSQTAGFRKLVEAEGPFDLVLVDGDHDEGPCRHDFETVHGSAKAIVLHDIVSKTTPGVTAVWNEIQERYADVYDFHAYIGQYDELVERTGGTWLGIGLAVRRDA